MPLFPWLQIDTGMHHPVGSSPPRQNASRSQAWEDSESHPVGSYGDEVDYVKIVIAVTAFSLERNIQPSDAIFSFSSAKRLHLLGNVAQKRTRGWELNHTEKLSSLTSLFCFFLFLFLSQISISCNTAPGTRPFSVKICTSYQRHTGKSIQHRREVLSS